MKNININYEAETIEVSKSFMQKASAFGTKEYKALKEARTMEPDFKLKVISNQSKKTYRSLTFEAMEAHIKLIETENEERTKVLKEFKSMITYATTRKSSYPIVKKWFLKKYKESYNNALIEEPNEEETKNTAEIIKDEEETA